MVMSTEELIQVVSSINGVPVRLTSERWQHITTSHLDMKNNQKLLAETIHEPYMILKGVLDELRAVRFFPKTHLGSKYLVVAYKEINKEDGFIITAYKASKIDKIMRRGIIWRKVPQ